MEMVPGDGEIAVDLSSRNLELPKLPGVESQRLRGTVSADLRLDGTLNALRGSLKVSARALHAAAMGKLAAASANFTLTLAGQRLAASGTISQPETQPVAITGSLPFDVPSLLRERQLVPASPLTASLRLPSSSLAFLQKISPEIRSVSGHAAEEIEVRGTIRAPTLSGAITAEVPRLIFVAASVAGAEAQDSRERRFRETPMTIRSESVPQPEMHRRLAPPCALWERGSLTNPRCEMRSRGNCRKSRSAG